MRTLLAASVALASTSAYAAETIEQRVVEIVKKACVAPQSPEAMVAAGERMAAANGWRFDKKHSGRSPLDLDPGLGPPEGPPFFVNKVWELAGPGLAGGHLVISIVGPEHPDVVINKCALLVPTKNFFDEQLADEVTRQFQDIAFKSKAKVMNSLKHMWALTYDGVKPAICHKTLMIDDEMLVDGNIQTIGTLEMKSPDTSGWKKMTEEASKCPPL